MSIKIISFLSSFLFFSLLLVSTLSFFINISTKHYIELKKNEIISYGQLIKNRIENLDTDFLDKTYIFNIITDLPEYVYFIIFDKDYNILLYFPYYFEVDINFIKSSVEFDKERVIIDSKEYLITYFLPIAIKNKLYFLAIEMDLKLVREFQKSLIQIFLFFSPLYIILSFLFSLLLSKIIQNRLNMIRDFAVKVALGNLTYDVNYHYKDELEDVFRSIKIMKNNLINFIKEIEKAKREMENSKRKIQNILESLPFTVALKGKDNKFIVFNNYYSLDIESIKNKVNENIIDIGNKKFKILKIDIEEGELVIFVDFTEIYKIEELKIKFLSEISHDLRTPLTITKSIISGLIHNPENLQEKIRKSLYYLDKMADMISKYLNYSKIKLRKISVNKIKINLKDFIDLIKDISTFFNFNIELEEKGKIDENKFLEIDIQLFQQLLFNLIDNACKRSNHAKIEIFPLEEILEIHIKNRAEYEEYQLVKDVFKGVKEVKGLGLNIIKEISEVCQIPLEILYEKNSIEFKIEIKYVSHSIQDR